MKMIEHFDQQNEERYVYKNESTFKSTLPQLT